MSLKSSSITYHQNRVGRAPDFFGCRMPLFVDRATTMEHVYAAARRGMAESFMVVIRIGLTYD